MSDRRTTNFSQKGFQGNLLAFMKKLEKNQLCCENFAVVISDYTPTSTNDTKGDTGNFAFDSNYLYVKTSVGWKRSALSTF